MSAGVNAASSVFPMQQAFASICAKNRAIYSVVCGILHCIEDSVTCAALKYLLNLTVKLFVAIFLIVKVGDFRRDQSCCFKQSLRAW